MVPRIFPLSKVMIELWKLRLSGSFFNCEEHTFLFVYFLVIEFQIIPL